jgi:hypothetical protein
MLQQIKRKGRKALDKVFNNRLAQRAVVTCGTMVFCVSETMARSKGAGGFSKATSEISSYQTPVSNLMKAIAAVIVLVGAFNVYFKMQNGDQDVKKTIMLTIGGCVAFIAMSEALPLFFK